MNRIAGYVAAGVLSLSSGCVNPSTSDAFNAPPAARTASAYLAPTRTQESSYETLYGKLMEGVNDKGVAQQVLNAKNFTIKYRAEQGTNGPMLEVVVNDNKGTKLTMVDGLEGPFDGSVDRAWVETWGGNVKAQLATPEALTRGFSYVVGIADKTIESPSYQALENLFGGAFAFPKKEVTTDATEEKK